MLFYLMKLLFEKKIESVHLEKNLEKIIFIKEYLSSLQFNFSTQVSSIGRNIFEMLVFFRQLNQNDSHTLI